MSLYIRFHQLTSVTETFFSDRNFCGWQKFVSVTETVYLWEKCVSLTKTRTGIGFCDVNLFFKGSFFSVRNFCRKETCFCDINFFSGKEICFRHGKYWFYINLFLWQKLFLSKIPCFGDYMRDFQGKFSVRNRSFRYLGWPR